MSSGIVKEMHC